MKTLSLLWSIASEIYHTNSEYVFLKNLLKPNYRIHDSSFGSGFPMINLYKDNFKNISCSDIDEGNLNILERKQEILKISFPHFKSSFKELPKNVFTKCDIVLCIGSSLSYCDSWDDEIKEVSSFNEGIIESILGMRSILNKNGKLIIGNSKLYQKSKSQDLIEFEEIVIDNHSYKMNWHLNYDWMNFKKSWTCVIMKDGYKKFDVKLISHLFNEDDLKKMCSSVFHNVEMIYPIGDVPEYYLICQEPK